VDTGLETSVPLVFAAGNLVHAAETADVAALGGRHAARHIAAALAVSRPPSPPDRADVPTAVPVPVTVTAPLAWISPNMIRNPATPPPRGRFLLRSEVFRRRAWLEVRQGDRPLARLRARLIPGRPVHLDAGWLARVRPSDGPVLVTVADA
jgi:hypothetical protein